MVTKTDPTWGTWKTHGHAEYVFWFGMDRKGPRKENSVVRITNSKGAVRLDVVEGDFHPWSDDSTLAGYSFGVATRFWAQPAVQVRELRHYSDGDSIAEYYWVQCAECKQADKDGQHEDWCSSTDEIEDEDPNAGVVAILPKHTVKDTRTAQGLCFCGCGAKITKNRMYRQGHDAKHVKLLLAEITKQRITVPGGLAVLPTQALRDKLSAQVMRIGSKLS